MLVTCRVKGCNLPTQSLPEKLAFLGTGFCGEHQRMLDFAADEARKVFDDDSFVRSAVIREAQSLIFPAGGTRLIALPGGRQ